MSPPQIVQILGSHFPLQVDGLDMGIDKKVKGWLIEVNIKPYKVMEKLDLSKIS
jgi:hypothetical protein